MYQITFRELEKFAEFMMIIGHEMSHNRVLVSVPKSDGGSEVASEQKDDGSPVSHYDVNAERMLRAWIAMRWKDMPVLAEEEASVLPDSEWFASIDPIDGTREFLVGGQRWGMSVGFLRRDGSNEQLRPYAGVVVQPDLRRSFAVIRGQGVQFALNGSAEWCGLRSVAGERSLPAFDINDTVEYLSACDGIKKKLGLVDPVLKFPAVAAGIEAAIGTISWWWSPSLHHWDLAATALMIEEAGGVVECVSGDQVPWDTIKMPKLLLASNRQHAAHIRGLLN